jgi:hypothetical protein
LIRLKNIQRQLTHRKIARVQATLTQFWPINAQGKIMHIYFGRRRIQYKTANLHSVPQASLDALNLPTNQPNTQVQGPPRSRIRLHYPKPKTGDNRQQQHQNGAKPN